MRTRIVVGVVCAVLLLSGGRGGAVTDVGGSVRCRVYTKREARGLGFPRRVATLMSCVALGTSQSTGLLVLGETAIAVDKRGNVMCSAAGALDPNTGAVVNVVYDTCRYYGGTGARRG